MNRSWLVTIAGALVVAVALGGCSGSNPVGEILDTTVGEAFRTPGECDDLVSAEALESSGIAPMTPVVVPHPAWEGARIEPLQYALTQAGGLDCEWHAGATEFDVNAMTTLTESTLTVRILPNARNEFDALLATYGPTAMDASCPTIIGGGAHCAAGVLVNDSVWVAISFEGIPSGASRDKGLAVFGPLVNDIVTRASEIYLPEPDDTEPLLGTLCSDILDLAVVAEARNIDLDTLDGADYATGVGIDGAATQRVGAGRCGYSEIMPDDEWGVFDLEWLSGGAWAMKPAPDAQQLVVAGLSEGDSVWLLRLDDTYLVEMAVDGHWLVLGVGSEYEYGAEKSSAVVAIIENIVANVRS